MTETTAMLVVSTSGSMLLALVGLPIAFLFNSASYLIAAASLWRLPGLSCGQPPNGKGCPRCGYLLI